MPGFSYREASTATNIPVGSLHRALRAMLAQGVLVNDAKGRWGLNKDYESWLTVPPVEQKRSKSVPPMERGVPPVERSKKRPQAFHQWNESVPPVEQSVPPMERLYGERQTDKDKERQLQREGPLKPTAKPLTGLQKVMRGFKEAKGINADDAAWDKRHFKRFARSAAEVLEAFRGNADAAIIYVLKKGQEFDDKHLSGWGLDAIARSAATDQRVLEFNRGEHGSQDGEMGKDSLALPGSGGGPTSAGDLAGDALRAIEHAALHRDGAGDVAGDGHDGAGD